MNAKMSDQEKITFANDLFWAKKQNMLFQIS